MRSLKKGYYLPNKILLSDIVPRNVSITEELINSTKLVYNGKQYIKVTVTKNMVGYKFGEFSFTRKIYQYKKGKKKNK